MKAKPTHTARIATGRGMRVVRCIVVEEHGERFVTIEFPHPTVRRFTGRRIIERSALVQVIA